MSELKKKIKELLEEENLDQNEISELLKQLQTENNGNYGL